MALSNNVITQFVKATKSETSSKVVETLNGTVVIDGGKTYVQLDGSEQLTPVTSIVNVKDGQRVIVTIENHSATVNGNVSSPAANTEDIDDVASKITEVEILVADKVSTKDFDAEKGRINELVADNVLIKDQLTADYAEIERIKTEELEAVNAAIDSLETNKLDADVADIKYATVENLEATDAEIYNLKSAYGEFEELTTDRFVANDAAIKELEAKKLDATSAELQFANIDFANIQEAAIRKIFSETGLIKDLVVGDQTIAGELVGVTLSGDLIQGNTIKADKLVVLGEDGVYYKLNLNALGATTVAGLTDEEKAELQNGLHGSNIIAKTITAEKISVKDLVAFGATIGGFNINTNSIYSGTKDSVYNTTDGVYMDNQGQFALGNSDNCIMFYKDEDGQYKLIISAEKIRFGSSGQLVSDAVKEAKEAAEKAQKELDEAKENLTCNLRIESSRGTVFKNSNLSTVLSVIIFRGSERITNMTDLRAAMGNSAYLQWKWQRLDDDSFGTILATDSHLSNDGFTYTISSEEIDTKVTFLCELIV